jgi:ABC-type antimicrobial peptide transport system permease subunit
LLYGVGALDAGVVVLVASIAGIAGVVAAVLPARRAAHVDPCVALRDNG